MSAFVVAQEPNPLQPDEAIECGSCDAWNQRREPFRVFFPLGVLLGCGGALIGFLVFGLFDIHIPGLDDIKITANHLVGAVAGTILLILILKVAGKGKKKDA